MRSLRRVALCVCVTAACGAEAPTERSSVTLNEGVVARVGAESVAGTTVEAVAAAQSVSLDVALEKAIFDATLAAGAREELAPTTVARLEKQVLAWAMLRELAAEARTQPLSEQELADVTDSSWTRYDRPEGRQVVHVVVRTDDQPPDDERARRRALADRLAEALTPVSERARTTEAVALEPEELFRWLPVAQQDPLLEPFEETVRETLGEVPSFVKVELLPPVAANGYLIQHALNDIPLDRAFVEAAMKLQRRGDIAGVVESHAGFHVMILIRRTSALRVPRDRRVLALSPIVEKWRGRQASSKMLARARDDHPIEQARNRLAWMRQVSFEESAP